VGGAVKQEAGAAARATATSLKQSLADKLRNLIVGAPGAGKGGKPAPAASPLPWILGGAAALGVVGFLVARR